MFVRKLLVALAACSMVVLPAAADDGWASRDYDFASRQMNDFTSRFERDLVNPVSRGVRNARPATRGKAVPITVPERVAQVPKAMAAAYPERDRARMEHTFGELLAGYRKIEKQFGLPQRDLAGAVAAFLAGSYMGYRNADFPDQNFPPLVEQMRAVIGSDPAYAGTSTGARQEMYERLAIVGMFMANAQMALKQRPDAQAEARVREAGKQYLEQFLKTDADRVQLTAQGVVLR